MGEVRDPAAAGRPAQAVTTAGTTPRPELRACDRRADGVTAQIVLPDVAGRLANTRAFAASHHRMVLESMLSTLSPDAWAPAVRAAEADRQAAEVRAEADRVERAIGRYQIELAEVRADRKAPGQLKLNRERQLEERINQLKGVHQGNTRDAAELERRAEADRQAAKKLYRDLAAEAVGRASRELVREADRELREWAASMPVVALLVAECGGAAEVQELAAELEGWVRADLVNPQANQPESPMGLEWVSPDGTSTCPLCQGTMAFSRSQSLWRCIECGVTSNELRHQDEMIRRQRGNERMTAEADVPKAGPLQLGPDGKVYPAQETGYSRTRSDVPAGPPAGLDQAVFPYHENWPPQPPDGDDVPLGNPGYQPAGGSDGQPGDPYAAAQAAYAHAQMAARGQSPMGPPPVEEIRTPALVEAEPTTHFDRTNRGWNPDPSGGGNNNGVFSPAEVERAATGGFLRSPPVNGPVTELGPNDFPV